MENLRNNPYKVLGVKPTYETDNSEAPVVIMIGIPGSGKSTFASNFVKRWNDDCREMLDSLGSKCDIIAHDLEPVVVSADHYFLDDQDEYVFDALNMGDAHAACLDLFMAAIMGDERGKRLIIVDNTNIHNWERSPYYMIAKTFKKPVYLVKVVASPEEAKERQSHGVPEHIIDRMHDSIEQPLVHWPAVIEVSDVEDLDNAMKIIGSDFYCGLEQSCNEG